VSGKRSDRPKLAAALPHAKAIKAKLVFASWTSDPATWTCYGPRSLSPSSTETESGNSDHNRPALQEALAACRRWKATLVIAKLDRLSRDAHFLTVLHKAGVKFVALTCRKPTKWW
jgi:hypothetical protein